MIVLHAWPGGLAVVVEGAAHRAVAVFGPDGWRRGEPRVVFPDGPPPGTQSTALAAPDWLADQLAPLDLSLGGVHTDFIRLDRLLSRLHAQAANGAVLVLGPRPAIVVLMDGRLEVVEPAVPAGAPALPILAGSDGWILVFTGRVVMPVVPREGPEALDAHGAAVIVTAESDAALDSQAGPQLPQEPVPPEEPALRAERVEEPAPPEDPALRAEEVEEPARPVVPAPAASPARERFVAAPSVVRSMPDDVAAEITAEAGEDALAAVALLDGSHTVFEIAETLGLSAEQVSRVVRLLVARRLAFRYVSRVRPAAGAKAPG